VRDASARGVVIAAGNPQLRAAAEDLARHRTGAGVTVLPSDHEAQVIAAVAAGALATPGEPLEAVMRAAVERCAVTTSSPDAIDEDLEPLLTPETEVVTIVLARGVPTSVADSAKLAVATVCRSADVNIYQGGHVLPGVLIGVEGS
jgi:hypothetical protein